MSGIFSGGSKVKNSGDFKMTSQARGAEVELINKLLSQMRGEGPSVADMQYKSAVEDALKANSAMSASSRGVSSAGLMNRNVMNANANIMNDVAQNSAMNKIVEQQGAQQNLMSQIGQQRGVALQSGIANQQATMQQRQSDNQLIGNIGASAAMAFSDENVKTNKKKGDALRAVEEFLNSVEPSEYNYKGGDNKDRLGVMAQDLEKSQIGQQMVTDTPDGKVVDYGQGFSAMMAGLAEMNKKIKKLEKKKG